VKHQESHTAALLVLLCRGKNYDRAWGHPDCPVRERLPNFDKQLEMQAK
jgi:hypothetical protein